MGKPKKSQEENIRIFLLRVEFSEDAVNKQILREFPEDFIQFLNKLERGITVYSHIVLYFVFKLLKAWQSRLSGHSRSALGISVFMYFDVAFLVFMKYNYTGIK